MLYNSENHKECFCQKGGGNAIALLRELTQRTMGTVMITQNEILFVVKGGGRIYMADSNISGELQKGDFVFLPAGSSWVCDWEENTTLLMVRMIAEIPECHAVKINGLRELGVNSQLGIHSLRANKRMWHFIEGLRSSLNDGLNCVFYMQAEVCRMIALLHAYYPPQERAEFFSQILTPDIKFSEFVRMNHTKYRTVGEMAEALFMTSQAFSNRFKKVFGMPPHQWMQREKARRIYLDICRNDMPLKEIALKYEFPLPSHFFRFCKQTFGESPGSIRKGLKGLSHQSA
jgi:AraC-like DNA-binding protein